MIKACTNYKKAYGMVPYCWMIVSQEIYKIRDKIIKFIEETMKNLIMELTAGEKTFSELKVK